MSILSDRPDGCGYFYGFRDNNPSLDHRQINVRWENNITDGDNDDDRWVVYVGGRAVGRAHTLEAGEALAIAWMDANPAENDE